MKLDGFERAVKRGSGLASGEAVTVAFSGGPDSTALLAALAAAGFRVEALHVNHGLRGAEAERDEALARETAKKLRVPFRAVRVAVNGRDEAAARRAREAAFEAAGASLIATGHTRDDQAETVLYRAARGAGPRGLRGILPRRELAQGVTLLRPLLDLGRADVLAYLKRRGLEFATDSTNADVKFARNRIRHSVLPELEAARPGAARHLAALAKDAAELDAWISREATAALARLRRPGGLDAAGLSALPPALRHAVLERLAGPLRAPHRAAIDLVCGGKRRIAVLGGGVIANRRGDVVRIVAPPGGPDADAALEVPGEATLAPSGRRLKAWTEEARPGFLAGFLRNKNIGEEALDASRVASPLTVGPPRRGERMRPLGSPGSRKIADILVDLGVPRSKRGEEIVVRDANTKVICLVGRRIAEEAKLTASTRTVLRLSCK